VSVFAFSKPHQKTQPEKHREWENSANWTEKSYERCAGWKNATRSIWI